MAKRKPKYKPCPRPSPSGWTWAKRELLLNEFDALYKSFRWQYETAGIKNIHILGSLRGLCVLYERISAHEEASRTLKEEEE